MSALVLLIVGPRLPQTWQNHPGIRYFSAPALVGLAGLSLLAIRLATDPDALTEELQILSGWNFVTNESAATLTVRADLLSLPFLIVVLLGLLAVMLLHFDPLASTTDNIYELKIVSWLIIGAGACFLFVAANGLTLIYAIMAFDTLTGFYWLNQKHRDLGVARLFLGVLTTGAILLASLTLATAPTAGFILLGIALWLRLGLYPFLEVAAHPYWRSDARLIYYGLSITVGLYLTIRTVGQPLPELVRWLIVLTALLSGLLAWLTSLRQNDNGVEDAQETRSALLTWLILTEALLVLVAQPLPTSAMAAFTVGLILSLVALWVTPALGRPRLHEQAWSWPYLPAAAATLTLIGAPFSLGWVAKLTMYESFLATNQPMMIGVVVLAEALAFSGLVRYWFTLAGGDEANSWWSTIGILAMVPFLTPGLAPFIFSALTQSNLSISQVELSIGAVAITIIVPVVGSLLGYFRHEIIGRLGIRTQRVVKIASLSWLPGWGQILFKEAGKFGLRVRVVLEGQHYIGWAVFTALVGALVILLS
ncbi:MAG: hypothetical protein H6631_11890 [Anaerolineaceae bacterium]|nr:hypothetical protein [Anaerolineaceae bacterium]MCB9099897.1 hypothetical protein [Anaerolineales bacterium]